MRNYCNRRGNGQINKRHENKQKSQVVFPPGVDFTVIEKTPNIEFVTYQKEREDTYKNAQGGAISQEIGFDDIKNKTDKCEIFSSIKENTSVYDYLIGHIGKYICVNLWSESSVDCEKTGILHYIGDGFITVKIDDELCMIGTGAVKYISISENEQ